MEQHLLPPPPLRCVRVLETLEGRVPGPPLSGGAEILKSTCAGPFCPHPILSISPSNVETSLPLAHPQRSQSLSGGELGNERQQP